MTDSIGTYEVRNAGGTAIRIWPLTPGTTVAQVAPPTPVVPINVNQPNPIVVHDFGVVDIAVALPANAPITRTAVTATGLTAVAGGNGVTSATIFADANSCQLTFAVDVGHATTPFEGTFHMTVQTSDGDRTLDIPLQVRPNTNENGLFIPFAVIQTKSNYTWVRLRAVSRTGTTPIVGATVQVRPVRDNSTVRAFNRDVAARTVTGGFLARNTGAVVGNQERSTVGLPIEWPIIFDITANTFVRRAQMLSFTPAQRTGHHNNNAFTPGDAEMVPVATANLSTRHFNLDPGHGIVYDAAARRCYEWFLAHRTAARIAELLRTRHSVPAANITFMRTAGLGMIDPAQVTVAAAPETGEQRYTYDMTARTVAVAQAAVTLTDISNLLLTTHTAVVPFPANAVPDGDRRAILTENAATIAAAVRRAMTTLPNRTAVAASERWNAATSRYVFDTRPTGNPTGPLTTHNIPTAVGDTFAVSNASLRRLAQRTARWSLNCEGLGTTAFQVAARTAMINANALTYMENAIVAEADRPAGDVFLNHGPKGWSFGRRRSHLLTITPRPDITLTLHHNALPTDGGTGRGNMMLASNPASATAAHMRLQKTFVKYVTGLGKGLREQGIVNNHASALNGPTNAALIPGYAFFENEFMNAGSSTPGLTFDYEEMVQAAFIDRTAEEIVAGLVEFLINPQVNTELDPPAVGKGITTGTVRW